MLDPISMEPQTEAARDLRTLAAIETILLDDRDRYAHKIIRIGMVLWDCNRHEAARRLGISQATAYRANLARPGRPLDDCLPSEWLTAALNGERHPSEGQAVTTALYSYYDGDGVLLYIGITDNLAEREYAHIRRSSWMQLARRSEIDRFATREEAEAEEKARIKTLRPLFNSQHNDDPDASRRLVDYLVSQGRTDLLAPAVSRG